MRKLALMILLLCPLAAPAAGRTSQIDKIVADHILPGFAALADTAESLHTTAQRTCVATDPALRAAYASAFKAWTRVSHLRFGPSEEHNRAFALAFWPDPRGKTPKALRRLLLSNESTRFDPAIFAQTSIAARGFYALDYLLFDPQIASIGTSAAHCALIRAVARDISATAQDLTIAWHAFAPTLRTPGPGDVFRTDAEVLRVLYKSAATGLQFTSQMRLGRVLASNGKPRPKRAEARRSGLSVILIQEATRGAGGLAVLLSQDDPALARVLSEALSQVDTKATALDDPTLAGVAEPASRFRIEALQSALDRARDIVDQQLGPHLGVSAGFNALDGD